MALKFAVNNSLSAITSLPSGISGGALNLISTQTASASASLEFSLDDSYDSYIFKFINIHPSVQSSFTVGFRDGSTNYDAVKTTTNFNAQHNEADTSTNLGYESTYDQAQGTGYLTLDQQGVGTDNDASLSGELYFYNPSSTTFVKHFISTTQHYYGSAWSMNTFVAGYCNTTTAIDGVSFKMSSGNIDDGIIKMYGVS